VIIEILAQNQELLKETVSITPPNSMRVHDWKAGWHAITPHYVACDSENKNAIKEWQKKHNDKGRNTVMKQETQ
jgi:hypothetical protein